MIQPKQNKFVRISCDIHIVWDAEGKRKLYNPGESFFSNQTRRDYCKIEKCHNRFYYFALLLILSIWSFREANVHLYQTQLGFMPWDLWQGICCARNRFIKARSSRRGHRSERWSWCHRGSSCAKKTASNCPEDVLFDRFFLKEPREFAATGPFGRWVWWIPTSLQMMWLSVINERSMLTNE